MKSYSRLWEQFLTEENYRLAVKNLCRHKGGTKRKYRGIRKLKEESEKRMPELLAYAAHYKGDPHQPKIIYDGIRKKRRVILVPTVREQVVHHMIINLLAPIITKSMYHHSYGSVPGRGSSSGKHGKSRGCKEAVERFIRKHPEECRYCLAMDIRKYFDSVHRETLLQLLGRKIRDERFLALLREVICFDGAERGIPIGYYTSQWFANFYLERMDHWIKEGLRVKGYFRYMDNLILFGSNKRKLHRIREAVTEYLREELKLEVNEKWQLFRFHYVKDGKDRGRDLDFIGYRFYRNRTTLRRSLMLRAARKAKRIAREKPKTAYTARQMMSYKGWLTNTDTYGMYKERIKPFVSFRQLRRMESAAQKNRNREAKGSVCGTGIREAV